MDQLYQDFSEKLLPKIQEGLVITKEYFIDLFGRYIKYLIITDLIYTVTSIIFFFIGLFLWKKGMKKGEEKYWAEGGYIIGIILGVIFMIVSFFIFFDSVMDLVKSIYIPEVRIYQELKPAITPSN